MCRIPHDEIKLHVPTFMSCTEKLPHYGDREAIVDGFLYRNCIACKSTLLLRVQP